MKIRWLIGLLMAASLLPGQGSTERGLVLAPDNVSFLPPLMGHMRWTGNRLASCDYCADKPVLWAVDRQGNREAVAFAVPGAYLTQVWDEASGPDGSFTAVGLATSDDSRSGSFIAWISPDTTRQVITRVQPYSPRAVTVASDGTIWSVGEMLNENRRVVYPNVLRHYTSSGQLLASTVVRGVRKNSGGLYNVSMMSELMVSNDRIGWLTATCQYIEFSFDAVQLGSYACPNGYTEIIGVRGVALSSADDLLIGGKWMAPFAPLQLDRAANTWKPVPIYQDSGKTVRLLGFDGNTLVGLSSKVFAMRRYTWADPPVAAAQ